MGSVKDVVGDYFETGEALNSIPLKQRQDRSGDGSARLVSVRIESADDGNVIYSTSQLKVTLTMKVTSSFNIPFF